MIERKARSGWPSAAQSVVDVLEAELHPEPFEAEEELEWQNRWSGFGGCASNRFAVVGTLGFDRRLR